MSTTYRVEGMTCGGCAQSVTRAIEALSKDVTVNVDLQQKSVAVEGFDDDESVGRAVTEAGFVFAGRVDR